MAAHFANKPARNATTRANYYANRAERIAATGRYARAHPPSPEEQERRRLNKRAYRALHRERDALTGSA